MLGCRNNCSTTAVRPLFAEMSNGVQLSLLAQLGSVPRCSSKSCTMLAYPSLAAHHSGDRPELSPILGSIRRCAKSSSTTALRPLRDAAQRGVSLLPSHVV